MTDIHLYLIVKTLHILSAVIITGTGFGTAFYLFMVNRTDSLASQAVVSRIVCKADWWFTTPAVIFQPLSGLWMMHQLKMPLTATWIWVTLGLFVFAGVCWLPVVKWQLQIRDIANEALAKGETTAPPRYWQLAKKWEMLGYPAFTAVLIIFFLMVLKPI
ncbi:MULTISPECIES: DUF2269 family protein [unclassified Moraxella]|uniref:DUF2269 family protein n=1 Tax=unclassified Moraxella TaxID=2685852 RepID=UPI003AF6BFFD